MNNGLLECLKLISKVFDLLILIFFVIGDRLFLSSWALYLLRETVSDRSRFALSPVKV